MNVRSATKSCQGVKWEGGISFSREWEWVLVDVREERLWGMNGEVK
jgi:hypothetical protein